jgi:hypothetical protein
MTYEEMKEGMLERPKDFAYFGDLDLSVWGFSPFGKHRDSDLLAESNFDYVLAALRRVSANSVEVMRTSHWLVGWYEHIMVRTTAKKTMALLYELFERYNNYIVLNEDDLARRECEQANAAYDGWARAEVAWFAENEKITHLLDHNGHYDPTPEDEELIRYIVSDAIMDYDPGTGAYRDSDLLEALREMFSELREVEQVEVLDF